MKSINANMNLNRSEYETPYCSFIFFSVEGLICTSTTATIEMFNDCDYEGIDSWI